MVLALSMKKERQVYTVEEIQEILGISRISAYKAATNGEFPVFRIGKRILIPKEPIDRLLKGELLHEGKYRSKP